MIGSSCLGVSFLAPALASVWLCVGTCIETMDSVDYERERAYLAKWPSADLVSPRNAAEARHRVQTFDQTPDTDLPI